jgi:hypothetical protein
MYNFWDLGAVARKYNSTEKYITPDNFIPRNVFEVLQGALTALHSSIVRSASHGQSGPGRM